MGQDDVIFGGGVRHDIRVGSVRFSGGRPVHRLDGAPLRLAQQSGFAGRIPAGPVRTLLRVIAREPDAVTRALARRTGLPVA